MRTAQAPNRRTLFLLIAALAIGIVGVTAVLVANSGTGRNYDIVDGTVTVELNTIDTYGDALTTNQGYPLYMFPPDQQSTVACTGECAGTWPPLYLPEGATVAAGPGVDASLLGTITAPDGQIVATYDGWPLYLYLGDISPLVATGQGQYLDGGYWYLIRADGELVRPNSAS